MFDLYVTKEQLEYATNMVNRYNFGQRGYGDGNKREQLTGVVGQTVFADLLGVARPNGATGFDDGYDFCINNKTVDIKTMSRSVPMRDYFVHNFVGYQKDYEVDYYVFASFNTKANTVTICGCVDKGTFFRRADYFDKGSIRQRSDGTTFRTFAPLFEIKQKALFPANSIDELLSYII